MSEEVQEGTSFDKGYNLVLKDMVCPFEEFADSWFCHSSSFNHGCKYFDKTRIVCCYPKEVNL